MTVMSHAQRREYPERVGLTTAVSGEVEIDPDTFLLFHPLLCCAEFVLHFDSFHIIPHNSFCRYDLQGRK